MIKDKVSKLLDGIDVIHFLKYVYKHMYRSVCNRLQNHGKYIMQNWKNVAN